MANITLLHWNIETYGPRKLANANNVHFINYIARLILNVNADIVVFVEVKNSIAVAVCAQVGNRATILQGLAFSPWRTMNVNSGKNNEAYIIMYRIDRNFAPIDNAGNVGPAIAPDNGFCVDTAAGAPLQFPGTMTQTGGRRPFYWTFQTTDTGVDFSVLTYHAMFGAFTLLGIRRIASCRAITQYAGGAIGNSFVSGDFNVDFVANRVDYNNVKNLPSEEATTEDTSLMNNPPGGNNPATFRAHAYDNIFQVPLAMPNPGRVVDLMVESARVMGPQPPPPAAQPHIGNLSAAAGAFVVASIPNLWALNPIVAVPPTGMNAAWSLCATQSVITTRWPLQCLSDV